MKISTMLKREDFYSINDKTLSGYFFRQDLKKTKLYVYEKLNAIITSNPSKHVKDYLLCEYDVSGSIFKRLAVNAYVKACLNTHGLMSDKKLNIRNCMTDDMLIYPCNKKYRIFDFGSNTVEVIVKAGFPEFNIRREIEFRTRGDLPLFVPRLIANTDHSYIEKIIDGKPVARIQDNEALKNEAIQLIKGYGSKRTVSGSDYCRELKEQINNYTNNKPYAAEILTLADKLFERICLLEKIQIGFSHGDLQPGNIWLENGTGHIYIIDWESWGERSAWYDEEVLYNKMRLIGMKEYLKIEMDLPKKCTVLAEDLLYHLMDREGLPPEIENNRYNEYIKCISDWTTII